MSVLATDVMDRARVHLNDVATDLYTNTVLLPILKIASDDLSDRLVANGVSIQKEVDSPDIELDSGDTELTLPTDFLLPISLFEKPSGDDDNSFVQMTQKAFNPNGTPGVNCLFWDWRNQKVYVNPASEDKEIRLRYYRILTAITGTDSQIEVVNSINYLSYHVAEIAAADIGKNTSESLRLGQEAEKRLEMILNPQIKQNQGSPVRRRRFRRPVIRRIV